MSFGVRPIGLYSSGAPAAPILGFNNVGNISLEAPRGEYDYATITIIDWGAVQIIQGAGGIVPPDAPTRWMLNGPITGVGGNFAVRLELSRIDIGPSIEAIVFGQDVTFETAPYDTGWISLASPQTVYLHKMVISTGGTLEGLLSIRNVATLETISRNFRMFIYPS